MAIGDIDGDGKKETVFTTEHSVEAYRYDNHRITSYNVCYTKLLRYCY